MALFDNNNLLSVLGGQDLGSNATQEQLQNLRNYGNEALKAQLPSTIYSPWQGAAYLLDKFQGRNAVDSAANIQKQAIIDTLSKLPPPNMPQAQQAQLTILPTNNSAQPQQQAQIQTSTKLEQPQTASVTPQVTQSPMGTENISNGDVSKLVIQSPNGQQSEVTPEQLGGAPPDGYKVVATIDKEGNERPIVENNTPQASQTTRNTQNNVSNITGAIPHTQPVQTQFGTLPPMEPGYTPEELYHMSQLPPNEQNAYKMARTKNFTPQTFDVGFGTIWKLPNGQTGFYSQPKNAPIEAYGVKGNQIIERNPETGQIQSNFVEPNGQSLEGFARHSGDVTGQINAQNSARTTAYTKGTEAQQAPIIDALSQSVNAQKQQRAYDLIEQIDNIPATANLHSGPYAHEWLDMQKAINDIYPGMFNTETIASGEALKKLVAPLATMNAKELTSRPTQFDFKTFIENNPGIENSPQGRKVLLSIFRSQAQQDIQLGQLANKYIKNPEGYNDAINEFYKNNPINIQYNGKKYNFAYGKPVTVDGQPMSREQFKQQMSPENTPKSRSWQLNEQTGKYEYK